MFHEKFNGWKNVVERQMRYRHNCFWLVYHQPLHKSVGFPFSNSRRRRCTRRLSKRTLKATNNFTNTLILGPDQHHALL